MLFTSPVFLCLFLPVVLATHFVLPRFARAPWLVIVSLFFYAWGEQTIVLFMIASVIVNWLLGLAVARAKKPAVVLAVGLNIGALLYFKYSNFFVANLNALLASLGGAPIKMAPIHLPIGISFVTFEAIAYIVDVYRAAIPAQTNPFHIGFYICFFPHLIAGPIVRFSNIAGQLANPSYDRDRFEAGVRRFILGFAKKLLLANPLGQVADHVFGMKLAELGAAAAWIGVLAYALQIYFDFSGYTDMAIGLGRLFGFELPENFNFPYAARSIRDFWRRWHISLSTWFRDYLYVPLGGNRKRTSLNLLLVFFFCGLWHGASWSFVAWGLFHGGFLAIERLRFARWLQRMPPIAQHAYAMLVVLVGWVFFRADTLAHAMMYLRAMFGFAALDAAAALALLSREAILAMTIGALLATVPAARLAVEWRPRVAQIAGPVVESIALLALFAASLVYMAASTYNPFIYFRF